MDRPETNNQRILSSRLVFYMAQFLQTTEPRAS
jgi:hypothetical protein